MGEAGGKGVTLSEVRHERIKTFTMLGQPPTI